MNIDNFETWFGVKQVCDDKFKTLITEHPELKSYFEEAFNEQLRGIEERKSDPDYEDLRRENERLEEENERIRDALDDIRSTIDYL